MTQPLRFLPIYQTRVWGGRRLASMLNRALPDDQPYGETWELCDRPEAQSVVSCGEFAGRTLHDLWTDHREEVFGKRYAGHPAKRFPVLLKILDCSDTLSIQVHPPEAVAAKRQGEPKTEMWFVAHADPGAVIYAGLKKSVTRGDFEQALQAGSVAGVVHGVTPQRGEFMFVESGRLHALGAGLLVYEIQQNSDTTYRVFDWNRVGLDGQPRTLHVIESLECIDFADFEPELQRPSPDGAMAACLHFDTRITRVDAGARVKLEMVEDFVCVAVTQGRAKIAGVESGVGDFLLVPPAASEEKRLVEALEDVEVLEIRLPVVTK